MTSSHIILQKPWSLFLLISCQQGLFYLYLMYIKQRIDLLIANSVLYCSSVLFWSSPSYGFRRNLDRLVVKLHTFYVNYCALTELREYSTYAGFVLLYLNGFMFYVLGCQFYKRQLYTIYTLTHIVLHTCGGFATYLLIRN